MTQPVYLDWNATAPMPAEVAAAVARATVDVGNPSSVHRHGRLARRAVETAREQVAALVGAAPSQVIFTSGATEANNLALTGRGAGHIVASAIEHVSVLDARADIIRTPATAAGVIDVDGLRERLNSAAPPTLVAAMLANNETGVVQPLADIAAVAAERGAIVHCDAVQAAGRLTIEFTSLGVDSLALSAHKIGGPMGIGALVIRDPAALCQPTIRGGGQERGLRAGTENVAGIVGFGAAAEMAATALATVDDVRRLRDAMEARIGALAPDAIIYGADAPRVANTSLIGLPGRDADLQVMTLDLAGIAVSAGAACSSGKVAPSHVLLAMGAGDAAANSAIRVSIGPTTTASDIDRFIAVWSQMYRDTNAAARAPAGVPTPVPTPVPTTSAA